MCEPATLASLAVAAVGTGLQAKAQRDAIGRQERAIREAEAEQTQLGSQRQEEVLQAAQNFVQPRMEQVVAPAQQRLEGVAEQSLSNWGNRPSEGQISEDYDRTSATRAAEEMRRAIETAQNQAKAGSPARLLQSQGMTLAADMGDVDGVGSLMRQASNRANANITRAGRVNVGQQALGSFLQGASGAIGQGVGNMGMSDYTSAARGFDITPQPRRLSIFG